MFQDKLYYLASAYTCKDKDGKYVFGGEEANFRQVYIWAARLIENGWLVYSPIAHTHPIHSSYAPFMGGQVHDMWYEYDNAMIELIPFDGIILCPGWQQSSGCLREKALFEELGREVLYFHEPCEISVSP